MVISTLHFAKKVKPSSKIRFAMNETVKFAKIKCRCGHVNLVPIIEGFHVFEPVKCEKCGKVIAEPEFSIES